MVYFPGQRPDEELLILTRPHWLTLLPAIIVVSLLTIVPVVILVAIPAAGLEITGIGSAVATAIVSAYYLALVTYFYIRWLDFYLDVAVVTSDRIVDIDQHGLFRRTIDELDCKMIQDVSASRHGLLQTLFNFGTVEIQTAGERRNFEFKGVPHPHRVQELVAKAQGMGEAEERRDTAKEHAEAAAAQAEQAAGAATEAAKAESAAKRPASPPGKPGHAKQAPGQGQAPDQSQSNRPGSSRHLDSQDLPREYE